MFRQFIQFAAKQKENVKFATVATVWLGASGYLQAKGNEHYIRHRALLFKEQHADVFKEGDPNKIAALKETFIQDLRMDMRPD